MGQLVSDVRGERRYLVAALIGVAGADGTEDEEGDGDGELDAGEVLEDAVDLGGLEPELRHHRHRRHRRPVPAQSLRTTSQKWVGGRAKVTGDFEGLHRRGDR